MLKNWACLLHTVGANELFTRYLELIRSVVLWGYGPLCWLHMRVGMGAILMSSCWLHMRVGMGVTHPRRVGSICAWVWLVHTDRINCRPKNFG